MNPRGVVTFEADGVAWSLCFSINAICALEDHLDSSIEAVGKTMAAGGMRLSLLRAVFWAGLQDAAPDITLAQAGDVMTQIGAGTAGELVARAFAMAFPEAGPATANPPKRGKPQAG